MSVNDRFLVLYNRGAKIIQGMPSGFYDGYDEEIHEVFVYELAGLEEKRLEIEGLK